MPPDQDYIEFSGVCVFVQRRPALLPQRGKHGQVVDPTGLRLRAKQSMALGKLSPRLEVLPHYEKIKMSNNTKRGVIYILYSSTYDIHRRL